MEASRTKSMTTPLHIIISKSSSGLANCPISRLNHDILLDIFLHNANMDLDPPSLKNDPITLRTLRAVITVHNASQVSASWRDLIINSPTVWANVLDLEFLDRSRDRHRDEIIRRTQKAMLHIKGAISVKTLPNMEPWWWLRFFEENWTRIRKLDLDVLASNVETNWRPQHVTSNYSAATWRKALPFLSKTSSSLESFRIALPYLRDPVAAGLMLFNNCAPQLRKFECKNMKFDIKSSWLSSQIHTLHIHENDPKAFRSVDELYEVISQMPLLESLSIENAISKPYMSNHRPPLSFPRLRYLNLKEVNFFANANGNSNLTSWALMNSIIPQAGCSARVALLLGPGSLLSMLNDGPHLSGLPILARLAENYFNVHQPTSLTLSNHQGQFRLTDLRVSEQPPQSSGHQALRFPFFDVVLLTNSLPPGSAMEDMLYAIFEALFFLSFPNVLDLSLIVGSTQQAAFSDSHFISLLHSFSSTEIVSTTPETLQYLSKSPKIDVSTLFPQLKVLKMTLGARDTGTEITIPFSVSLKQFLLSRREAGVPVRTLELKYTYPFGPKDFKSLEIVKNLKVVWKIGSIGSGEYMCGSGRPEELDFAEKIRLAKETKRKLAFESDVCV